jgi:2-hydroxycyclohexanecarboxyl-CoA dehydrogenase
LEATVRAIEADGGAARALPADVADGPRVSEAVGRLTDAAGGPPLVLVHCAGIPGKGTFLETDDGQWTRMLGVHVRGAERTARATLPAMLEAGWGRVVIIGSDAAWTGDATVPYSTAKAALIGFVRSLAREVAPSGVPERLEAELATVLRGSFLSADEVAETVAFLVGPGGDAYVGQVLSPNGGTVFT